MEKSLSFVLKSSKVSSVNPAKFSLYSKSASPAKSAPMLNSCHVCVPVHLLWSFTGPTRAMTNVGQNKINKMSSVKILPSPQKYPKSQTNQSKPGSFTGTQSSPRASLSGERWRTTLLSGNRQNYFKWFQPCPM